MPPDASGIIHDDEAETQGHGKQGACKAILQGYSRRHSLQPSKTSACMCTACVWLPAGPPTIQREEWDEGMPPESTTALMSQMPFLTFLVKICRQGSCQRAVRQEARKQAGPRGLAFMDCAVSHAQKPTRNTWFEVRFCQVPLDTAGTIVTAAAFKQHCQPGLLRAAEQRQVHVRGMQTAVRAPV